MKVAEDRAIEQERRRGRSGKGSESALWECEKWVSESESASEVLVHFLLVSLMGWSCFFEIVGPLLMYVNICKDVWSVARGE